MEWYGDLSAGIEEIDRRYKALVAILKELSAAVVDRYASGVCAGIRHKLLHYIWVRI